LHAEWIASWSELIPEWSRDLAGVKEDMRLEFVHESDETGWPDDENSREIKVLASACRDVTSVTVLLDHYEELSILTRCIGVSGLQLPPFVIVPPVTAEKNLEYSGHDHQNLAATFQTH
jgi:hypothetical protein